MRLAQWQRVSAGLDGAQGAAGGTGQGCAHPAPSACSVLAPPPAARRPGANKPAARGEARRLIYFGDHMRMLRFDAQRPVHLFRQGA